MSTRVSISQAGNPSIWHQLLEGASNLFGFRASTALAEARPATASPEFIATVYPEALSIGLIGDPRHGLAQPGDWLSDQGCEVRWLKPAAETLEQLARSRQFNVVMIDLDSLGGIDEIIEPLLALRRRRPGLSVLVVSGTFMVDDVSVERLPLCDCSLRAPVGFLALDFALGEAMEVNTPAWMERVALLDRH
jgi:CheY-like chemotaxis protein